MYNRKKTRGGKRQDVIAAMTRLISEGKLPPGSQLPSTRSLAAQFDVSLVTAHKAAQALEGMGLVERRARQGTFVRQQGISKRAFVGKLFTYSDDHVWGDVTTTLVSGLQRQGLMSISVDELSVVNWTPNEGQDPLAQLVDSEPLAIIMRGAIPLERLEPFVHRVSLWIALEPMPATGLGIETIAPDIVAGMRAAVGHLISLGHQRIVFASFWKRPERGRRLLQANPRYAGYKVAMEHHGLEPRLQVFKKPENGEVSEEFHAWVRRPEAPTAIICQTDWYAVEMIRQCERLEIRVPQDLAFVGGYNTPWAEMYDLTSIHYRYLEIARSIVDRVAEQRRASASDGVQHHKLFTPRLVLRGSTCK